MRAKCFGKNGVPGNEAVLSAEVSQFGGVLVFSSSVFVRFVGFERFAWVFWHAQTG